MSRMDMVKSIAVAQDGLITRQQLLEIGYSTYSIERRRRNGLLVCLYAGVYQVGPITGPQVRERAALLACGGGVVSHVAAAVMWQLLPASRAGDIVDVTLPQSQHARQRKGVRAHRRTLRDDEITAMNGVPVTTPARTVFDLAALTTRELDIPLQVASHAQRRRIISFHSSSPPAWRGPRRMSGSAATRSTAIGDAPGWLSRLSWHQLTKERDRTLVQLALALAKAGE